MRGRARNHGWSKRASEPVGLLVVALIAVMGVAPIATSWHELTVRHVVCAEHGELTHVRTTSISAVVPSRAVASVTSEEGGAAEGHEHCSTGFLVRARLHLSVVRSEGRYVPPPAITRVVRESAPAPGRAFVLASAPKTSPPSA